MTDISANEVDLQGRIAIGRVDAAVGVEVTLNVKNYEYRK